MKFREKLNALRNIPLGDWRILMRVLGIYRRKFFLAIALSFVGIALSVVVPILSQKIIDSVMVGKDGWEATQFAAIAIVAAVIRHMTSRWHNSLINDVDARFTARLSRRIYFRLMRIPYESSASAGGSTINLLNESQRVASFMLSAAPNFFLTILGAAVSFAVALYYDYLICLLAFVVALVFAVFARKTNAQLGEASRSSFRLNGVLQGATAETVGNIRGIKSNAVERFFIGRWSTKSAEAVRARWHILDLSHSYSFTLGLLSEILTLLVVVVGCWRILRGDLTIGGLLALQLLVTRATMPMLTSAGILIQFHSVSATVSALAAFLKRQPERAIVAPALRAADFGPITVENLTFRYPEANTAALDGVSLVLPTTGVVAIVGRNGSGKSSLLRVLLGLERDYGGKVAIGGIDVRAFNPRWLRGRIGVVDQETSLFSGTIRENLQASLARPMHDDEIEHALAFSSADKFTAGLPKGIDTELVQAGQNLSGGQRQRLAISRAVLRDPHIAVFDEPTSALDAESAMSLERRLLAFGRDRLVIIVTHHLFSARSADMIVVLDEGKIVGVGSHEALEATCETYQTLWRDYVRN